jgi:hypothetical protein
MTLLNTADAIYLGSTLADRVFLANTLVWPESPYVSFDPATAINVFLSTNKLVVTNAVSGSVAQGAKVVPGRTSGKFYYEAQLTVWVPGDTSGDSVGVGGIGIVTTAFDAMHGGALGGVMLQSAGGRIWANGTIPSDIGARTQGDVIGFAVDLDNLKFWCRLVAPTLGDWNGSSSSDPTSPSTGIDIPSGTLTPFCTFGGTSTGPNNKVTTTFGSVGFVHSPPAGFTHGWPLP